MRYSPSRRGVLAGAIALIATPALATQDPAVTAAIRAVIGDASAEEGGITLRLPAIAENGGQVPLTVLVDSPQTAERHVTAIHVFATRNPTPGVADFRLTPFMARAEVQTRIRLAEEQRVIVLARFSDGTLRQATADVRVTTGGCLT